MAKYTIKRLLQSLVTVVVVATIVFLLMRMLPTDSYFSEDQLLKLTEEQKNDQLEAAGLLDPVGEQLARFYGQIFRGDFGESRRIQTGVPVLKVIGSKFTISMRLGCTSLVIALILGVLMGIGQTLHKDRLFDHIGTGFTVFVNAVPSLVSYSLVLVFGSKILGLPSLYSPRYEMKSSILPITCLALASIASYALWTRRYMVDELNKDYIRLAKIKGMSSKNIMVKHVFKNAFVPLVQYIPANFLLTIGGSLLVERFFSVPGMGPLLTDAISRYDVNVVQTLAIIYAGLGVLGVFLCDVMMMLIDPRIRLTGKGETR